MKHILLPLALLAATLASPAFADTSTPAVGKRGNSLAPEQTVKPGQTASNADGVRVENDKDSNGDMHLKPKKGTRRSSTEVRTDSSASGCISGLDSNDTVRLGSSNNVTVSGNGGEVHVSGSSNVTVTNTGGKNAVPMTVKLTSGTQLTVPPGNTVQIST